MEVSGSEGAKVEGAAHRHCVLAVGVVPPGRLGNIPHGTLCVYREGTARCVYIGSCVYIVVGGGNHMAACWEFADKHREGAETIPVEVD